MSWVVWLYLPLSTIMGHKKLQRLIIKIPGGRAKSQSLSDLVIGLNITQFGWLFGWVDYCYLVITHSGRKTKCGENTAP